VEPVVDHGGRRLVATRLNTKDQRHLTSVGPSN
jgi:hypothetical protein